MPVYLSHFLLCFCTWLFHNNPVEAGLLKKPEEYLCSAKNYAGEVGLIHVELIL